MTYLITFIFLFHGVSFVCFTSIGPSRYHFYFPFILSEYEKVSIFLNYSPDGERPLLGSLKVKVETEGEEELDHTEALVDQCQAFYTHRLKEAIIEAF